MDSLFGFALLSTTGMTTPDVVVNQNGPPNHTTTLEC